MEHISAYALFLKRFMNLEVPVVVVTDASNGSAGPILSKLQDSKLHIIALNDKPDGNFSAHGTDSSDPRAINEVSAMVLKNKADFGVILDSDGDRVVFIDNSGEKISADEAAFILSEGVDGPITLSVAMGELLKKKKHAISPAGHYFIKGVMKKKKSEFGAESSGHYYFKFNFEDGPAYYDSGLRALVEMANRVSVIKADGMDLRRKLALLPKFIRSGELNFETKSPSKILAKIEKEYGKRGGEIEKIDGLTVSFPVENWWFNIRKSNTENLLRLNVESRDPKIFKEELSLLKGFIEE